MFCTSCEMETDDLGHYKSQLHVINLKRKLSGYTPITQREFDHSVSADEFIIDLNHNHIPERSEECCSQSRPIGRKELKGATAHAENSAPPNDHEVMEQCLDMGFNREQISYILRRQCYICYERFAARELLFKHIESGMHRSAVTDGTSLYLLSGRVLLPSRRSLDNRLAVPVDEPVPRKQETNREYEEFLDKKRLEELKCSLHNGNSYKKKPF